MLLYDEAGFAKYYTRDAIYLPYFSRMIEGWDSIGRYYVRHEDPAVGIDTAHVHIRRLTFSGRFAIVDGYYGVDWRVGGSSGHLDGKSLNILRRDQDCVIRLFWRLTNHD